MARSRKNRRDGKDKGSADASGDALHGKSSTQRIGRILIEEGAITEEELNEALEIQVEKGGFIGQILVDLEYVEQDTIVSSLVKQCKIPHLSLLDYEVGKEVLKLVPQEICLAHHLLPIDKLGRILTVAMVNPLDDEALEAVRQACPDLRIKPILCDWRHFSTVTARVYGLSREDDGEEAYDVSKLRGLTKRIKGRPKKWGDKGEKAAAKAAPQGDNEVPVAALDATVSDIIKEAEAAEAAPAVEEAMAADAIHEGLSGAVREALAAVKAQTEQEPRAVALGGPTSAQKLGDVLRTAVRDALRESEAAAVTRANRAELEARDAERALRRKHASVSAFKTTRPKPLRAPRRPESHAESDQRVMEAMTSERLLEWFTFDGFFVGANNQFTHKLCRAVADQPGGEFNPFFVYGDVGLGKTHIINAIGNAVSSDDPDRRVGYVSSSHFAARLGDAIRDQAVDVFRENYCHWDLLILDDIQFLGGRVEAQEEFFHIFNVLQQQSRQIIIAADKSPDRLGMLEQRLVSRFAGGIVANLSPPEWETRMAILRHHVDGSRVGLPEEVLGLIATRVPHDVRKMIGALRKVMAYAELQDESLCCETANEILDHLGIEEPT